MNKLALNDYFLKALSVVQKTNSRIIDLCERRTFKDATPFSFFLEYAYVVLNSGMKHSVAVRIYDSFVEKFDFNVIGHEGKRKAIRTVSEQYSQLFKQLQDAKDKIVFLESLPFIGSITKFHLARNLGIDCVKPDCHLVRLADKFESTPDEMCGFLAEKHGYRIGTIDYILWEYTRNQTGKDGQTHLMAWSR